MSAVVISFAEQKAKRAKQREPNLFSLWFDLGWWWLA